MRFNGNLFYHRGEKVVPCLLTKWIDMRIEEKRGYAYIREKRLGAVAEDLSENISEMFETNSRKHKIALLRFPFLPFYPPLTSCSLCSYLWFFFFLFLTMEH